MIDHRQPFDIPEWHAIARETKLVCQLMGTGVTSLGRAGYSDMMGEYYTAFFSLSVGIERLAKLILVVDHAILNGGTMPTERVVKNYGHKLVRLLNNAEIIENNYGLTLPFKRPTSKISCKIIDCLDAFADAARGRYANFAALGDPNIYGSSRNSGKSGPDFEEEVGVIPEAVGHAFDHLDLVVDSFQEAGV